MTKKEERETRRKLKAYKRKKAREAKRPWKKRADERIQITREAVKIQKKLHKSKLRTLGLLEYDPQILVCAEEFGWDNESLGAIHKIRVDLRRIYKGWTDAVVRVTEEGDNLHIKYGSKVGKIQIAYVLSTPSGPAADYLLSTIAPGCKMEKVVTENVSIRLVCDKDKGSV